MGRIFRPGRFSGATAPEVQSMEVTVGQTFLAGAVLIYEAGNTGKVQEGGADPAAIVGIAMEAAGSKPGTNLNFDSTVVARTGNVFQVSVAKANRTTIFTGRAVNGGTDPVTPALTDIGKTYSILKSGAGEWTLDAADVANQRVKIVDVDIDSKIFFFKVLEANLATP